MDPHGQLKRGGRHSTFWCVLCGVTYYSDGTGSTSRRITASTIASAAKTFGFPTLTVKDKVCCGHFYSDDLVPDHNRAWRADVGPLPKRPPKGKRGPVRRSPRTPSEWQADAKRPSASDRRRREGKRMLEVSQEVYDELLKEHTDLTKEAKRARSQLSAVERSVSQTTEALGAAQAELETQADAIIAAAASRFDIREYRDWATLGEGKKEEFKSLTGLPNFAALEYWERQLHLAEQKTGRPRVLSSLDITGVVFLRLNCTLTWKQMAAFFPDRVEDTTLIYWYDHALPVLADHARKIVFPAVDDKFVDDRASASNAEIRNAARTALGLPPDARVCLLNIDGTYHPITASKTMLSCV